MHPPLGSSLGCGTSIVPFLLFLRSPCIPCSCAPAFCSSRSSSVAVPGTCSRCLSSNTKSPMAPTHRAVLEARRCEQGSCSIDIQRCDEDVTGNPIHYMWVRDTAEVQGRHSRRRRRGEARLQLEKAKAPGVAALGMVQRSGKHDQYRRA